MNMLKMLYYRLKNKKNRKKSFSFSPEHAIVKPTEDLIEKRRRFYSRAKEGQAMATVFDVANWFLHKESMDHKKLQKLCYYSQAWSLALNGKKLIDEEFEAWVHGPVNRALWNSLRDYGYSNINPDALNGRARPLDSSSIQLLEKVWATYKDLNGFQLENLTHRELPWIQARGNLAPYEPSNSIIRKDTMKMYYRSLISAEGVGE